HTMIEIWKTYRSETSPRDHFGRTGSDGSCNSYGGTATTLPSRQIWIGRPVRMCSCTIFWTATLSAISARTSRGNLRISEDGLLILLISLDQSAVGFHINYTKLPLVLQSNN